MEEFFQMGSSLYKRYKAMNGFFGSFLTKQNQCACFGGNPKMISMWSPSGRTFVRVGSTYSHRPQHHLQAKNSFKTNENIAK